MWESVGEEEPEPEDREIVSVQRANLGQSVRRTVDSRQSTSRDSQEDIHYRQDS